MQVVDEVKVASFHASKETDTAWFRGYPVELGGRGKVVRLWAAHYTINGLDQGGTFFQYATGLSENPEHELDPPGSAVAMARQRSVYGRHTWHGWWAGNAGSIEHKTAVIPLYGILRPRRQIWVMVAIQAGTGFEPVLELYYTPEDSIPRAILDTINRARGKYRRS